MTNYQQYGDTSSKNHFIQLGDDHDLGLMESEAALVREMTGSADWCITAYPVRDWDRDLTPWSAPPVFGKRPFGDGAPETLQALMGLIEPGSRTYLCGYSLAGLFALWAACQTDAFAGIVAASPSVWYPDWIPYAQEHPMRTPAVYLSLGDREEKAKNPVLASVGGAVRRQHELLTAAGIRTVLEWNPGNHFVDSDRRLAKGIAWLLKAGGAEKP